MTTTNVGFSETLPTSGSPNLRTAGRSCQFVCHHISPFLLSSHIHTSLFSGYCFSLHPYFLGLLSILALLPASLKADPIGAGVDVECCVGTACGRSAASRSNRRRRTSGIAWHPCRQREHAWMPRLVTDAFGLATVSLISIFVILGLICIIYSVYFRSRIQNQGPRHLGYFNGPWIIRIVLIVVAIWWGLGEIIRLSLLKGEGRLFTKPAWQKGVCKFYIVSNIGFAEPSLFLLIVYLLHASLQKREHGALSHGWNMRAAGYTFLLCLPMFLVQLILVLIEPMINNKKHGIEMKIQKYFTSSSSSSTSTSSLTGDGFTSCTYPLMNTVVLGFFDFLLVIYISCLGFGMVSSVMNKGLERRIYLLIFSVVSFFPIRVCLLGFSILPIPGSLVYEALVFLAFLMLLFCALVGISVLVYCPVADSLALGNLRRYMELEEIPVHDDNIFML